MELLIADPDAPSRNALVAAFRDRFDVYEADSAAHAIDRLCESAVPIVVADIRIASVNDFALVKRAKDANRNTLIILITGVGRLETALEAVGCGAFDYISKPYDIDDLRAAVDRAAVRWNVMTRHLDSELVALPSGQVARKALIGGSRKMLDVYRAVAKATKSHGNVLISGETGTGKELVARAIHENSLRRGRQLIALNCAALPDTLLESELFGHVRGSFTGAIANKRGFFEEANGGALFLDEIGDISPSLQVKLLRAIQEGEIRPVGASESKQIDVRVIAATHRDLGALVAKGVFREDLYYRLKVITVHLPPLRERMDDLMELVNHFLFRAATRENKVVSYLSEECWALLRGYPWPGNIRELEHAIEHAVSMTTTPVLFPEDFPEEIRGYREAGKSVLPAEDEIPKTLDEVECTYIVKVLERTNFNISKAAEILGIDRGTLYRKAEKYHIQLKKR